LESGVSGAARHGWACVCAAGKKEKETAAGKTKEEAIVEAMRIYESNMPIPEG
jgi:hypothetical protein